MDTKLPPVFSVRNRHADACDVAPPWTLADRTEAEARSYFENHHGEQWIASVTPDRFLFTGGDISWKTVRVDDPNYDQLAARCADQSFDGIVLNIEERLWLCAVLTMASQRWSS